MSDNTPGGITIIVDTREIQPYTFASPDITVIRRALPNGDYSLDSYDYELAVERKSLPDLVQTVIHDRERFRRELRALQSYRGACIVVEGSLLDVVEGDYPGGAAPNSVFGSVVSICVDWGIPVFFTANRQVARQYTESWLCRWFYKLQREKQ